MSVANEKQILWTFLQEHGKGPLQKNDLKSLQLNPKRKVLSFASQLIEAFGARFAQQIRARLGEYANDYTQLYGTYQEIQEKLKAGQTAYIGDEFPQTKALLDKYRSESQGDERLFARLKQSSYAMLSFPQKILTYPHPDREIFSAINEVRDKAFRLMILKLRPQDLAPVDEKRSTTSTGGSPKSWSQEEETAVTQLYFGGGAFIHKNETIYFYDLIETWHQRTGLKDRWTGLLSVRHWVDQPPRVLQRFSGILASSFKEFLIKCSIRVLEDNLQIKLNPTFSPSLEKKLTNAFQTEEIRSDVCYFTADPQKLLNLDLGSWNGRSKSLLTSFRLFFSIVERFKVAQEKHRSLLQMIVSRNEQGPQLDSQVGAEAFTATWDRFVSLFAKNWEESLDHPFCWPLFLHLMQTPKREAYFKLFEHLGKRLDFVVTVRLVYDFCRQNKEIEEFPEIFVGKFGTILKEIAKNYGKIKNSERLFFDPPLDLVAHKSQIDDALAHTVGFFDGLRSLSKDPSTIEDIFTLLRNYLLRPAPEMFILMRDLKEMKAGKEEKFIEEVLSSPFEPLKKEELAALETARPQAKKRVEALQKRYQFSGQQLCFIYLEFIRVILAKKEEELARTSRFIQDLSEFCPALKTTDIYFLFRYHNPMEVQIRESRTERPVGFETVLDHLSLLRKNWAISDRGIERFIVDPRPITDSVKELVQLLAKSGSVEEERGPFENSCHNSLLSAFFPPLQPLNDYLRVNQIDEKGVVWRSDHLATHLGQLKLILGESSLGIYFNWMVIGNKPTLFFSFFDLSKKRAISSFQPLNVPLAEITEKETRRAFYGLLYTLGHHVLPETPDNPPDSKAEDIPATWISSYTGVQETLDTSSVSVEHQKEIWDFLRRTKIAYRTLFLSSVVDRPFHMGISASQAAAQGHIFRSHPRGSLLPEFLLNMEEPKYYIPDAPEEFVATLMARFSKSANERGDLGLNLTVVDKGGAEKALPILVQVQTKSDLIPPDEASSKAHNEMAPSEDQEAGSWVTIGIEGGVKSPLRYPPKVLADRALFQTYFDFHNLLLKAAYYRSL